MQRHLIGIVALLLLATWGALEWFGPADGAYAGGVALCSKLGAVLAVIWLALPEARQPRNSLWIALVLVSAPVLVWRPKLLPLVMVIFVAVAILRPRAKTSSRGQSGSTPR